MNSPVQMSDEKLIQFYLNGNPKAMATLVELYKDKVYGVIYSMVQDKYAAEEIFREVFVKIINNLLAGKTPEEGEFLPWAIRHAHALCVDHARNSNKAAVLDNNTEPAPGVSGVNPVPLVMPGAFYHESHGKIKTYIDMLPETQREVIVLKHYGGLSFKEIAAIMKCSLTTALDTMKLGLNNLCSLMTDQELVLG